MELYTGKTPVSMDLVLSYPSVTHLSRPAPGGPFTSLSPLLLASLEGGFILRELREHLPTVCSREERDGTLLSPLFFETTTLFYSYKTVEV